MWSEKLRSFFLLGTALGVSLLSITASDRKPQRPLVNGFITLPKSGLLDKIKGGWAGQAIGCTYGGPTEFRFQSTFIPDYQPLSWSRGALRWYFENAPGLYDDIYMDLTFVEVIEEKGLDAPAEAFAEKFAQAGYPLWHANQMARYNILNGIGPPQSGHWLNNPHADDIDFQIEADFAGLMSPGMVRAATGICDRVGHIMNHGDGYYGGLYVAAMYALAFVEDDVRRLVDEALRVVPEQSLYARTIRTVIEGFRENPRDWRETWFRVQKKWGEDVGCPEGIFRPFNIDARINSAWVVLGLLYGEGDFGRTVEISTRAGDDSDCNPATAGGILGTMLGYEKIPDVWKMGLAAVEDLDFNHTNISLSEAYALSFKHALEMIKKNGGEVDAEVVRIKVQKPEASPLEVGFVGHYPEERRRLDIRLNEETREAEFDFEGVGFVVNGGLQKLEENIPNAVLELEVRLDDEPAEKIFLPSEVRIRKPTPFWRFRLQKGKHRVRVKLLNPEPGLELRLTDAVIYASPRSG